MTDLTAAFERRLRREANRRPAHPLLRSLLLALAVAILAFAAGAATQRALLPPDFAALQKRGDNGGYYLPVKSRQLTVMLQPLVTSAQVEQLLAVRDSAPQRTARELVSQPALQRMAREDLPQTFPLRYTVGGPLEIPDELFDAQRRQYRTEELLHWLAGKVHSYNFRTIGVLYADVYDEGYNFLFGQARLGGSVCIVSSARMGMDVGEKSPHARFSAICAHELGHTLGLRHVKDRRSIMAYADSLAQHDSQGTAVTAADWQELKKLHPIVWDTAK